MEKIHWPRLYTRMLVVMTVLAVSWPLHTESDATSIARPAVLQAATSSCSPPYSSTSPWNTRIPASPQLDPKNSSYISGISGAFGSDPTQFTYPVYRVTSATAAKTITISGKYSNVTNNGLTLTAQSGGSVQVQVPAGAQQAAGSDSNIVIWNQTTGDEWAFWQARINPDGSGTAVNGYHYNTNWSGVPPSGFGSRGSGLPYLAGLIFPCEMSQGHIDHAIAFAYNFPSSQFVYPATKSDGSSTGMPEGTHLQLDPNLTPAQIQAWGCTGSCLTIAKALQQYGMYLIDFAGHPKLYAEYEGTAHWNGVITASTVSKIPYTSFRVLAVNAAPTGKPGSVPTVTPVITNTKTGTQAGLTLLLHGIGTAGDNVSGTSGGNTSPRTVDRQVTLYVSNSSNQLVATLTGAVHYGSAQGNFTGTIPLGALASGVYTVQLKVPHYLKRTIPGIISITSGSLINLPTVGLIAGDVNDDNQLNIIDYNTILDCFSDLAPARNCDATKKLQTDITDDGSVNQFDYNLFLREISVQGGA